MRWLLTKEALVYLIIKFSGRDLSRSISCHSFHFNPMKAIFSHKKKIKLNFKTRPINKKIRFKISSNYLNMTLQQSFDENLTVVEII